MNARQPRTGSIKSHRSGRRTDVIGGRVLIANIGWAPSYNGEPISSAQGYVVKNGTGAEAYNFSHAPDGLFYGYVRGGLAKWQGTSWTIVFVSKPANETGLRVIGWYENAVLGGYLPRKEYRTDPDFPVIDKPDGSHEQYIYNSVTSQAFFVSAADREKLYLPKGHPIKSGGVYYLDGVQVEDSPEQARIRARIAAWVRESLPKFRQSSRIARAATIRPGSLPGVEIGEDGKPSGFSPVAESSEHEALKLWACRNSERVAGLSGNPEGEVEVPLFSGDRVDVVYRSGDNQWVVEVKPHLSPEDDHRRGIYQCVKYRAVAAAMKGEGSGAVTAVLVTQRPLSTEHQARVDLLDIKHVLAPMDLS